jgi:hypothetical protein
MNSPKTMEINPRHPIISKLKKQVQDAPDAEETADTAWLLYDTALLQSGFAQDDVDAFALRMYRTMKGALKLDSLDLEEELEVPAEAEPPAAEAAAPAEEAEDDTPYEAPADKDEL